MKKANSGDRGSAAKGNVAPKNVDEYLAAVPEPARSTLNRIRAAIRSAVPPEAIGLQNGTTGEDHVVDVSSYFPRIFRLQNPRVALTDDLCRVLEVMKS